MTTNSLNSPSHPIMDKEACRDVFQDVRKQVGDHWNWQPLAQQGTTHHLYRGHGKTGDINDVVLRIHAKVTPIGVDHTRELTLLFLFESQQLSGPLESLSHTAKPISVIASGEGWVMMPYVEGGVDTRAPQAQGLSLLTLLRGLKGLPNPDDSLSINYQLLWDSYEQLIDITAEYALLSEVKKYFHQLPMLSERCVHHDLHPGNCLYDGQQTVLIDWEYAGWGQPWADLDSLHFHWKITYQELYDQIMFDEAISFPQFVDAMQVAREWMKALDKLWIQIAKKEA
jgi:thiamine kinase